MKLVPTAFAPAVISAMVLYGCGSNGGDEGAAAPSISPSRAAAGIVAEPPSAGQQVTTAGTASPKSLASTLSIDFETPPGIGSTRRTP